MTLKKPDLQKFIKRLREHQKNWYIDNYGLEQGKQLGTKNPLKYYAVGEYGETRSRPHYHAIIFGVTDPLLFKLGWTLGDSQLGFIHVGTVTSDSMAYCLKYIDKQKTIPKHKRDDRTPEFSIMSKGLGKSYYENPAVVRYHKQHPDQLYLTKPGGHKIAMPKYYREKIFSEAERKAQTKITNSKMSAKEDELKEYLKKKGVDYDAFRDLHIKGIIEEFNNNLKKRNYD